MTTLPNGNIVCPLCGQVGSPPNCTGCDPEITRAAEVGEGAAEEIERLRAALEECERLASRDGPPSSVTACNKIEVLSRKALKAKP